MMLARLVSETLFPKGGGELRNQCHIKGAKDGNRVSFALVGIMTVITLSAGQHSLRDYKSTVEHT
jgi:hypothetical protein